MVQNNSSHDKTIKDAPKGYFLLFGWVYGLGLDGFDIAVLGLLGNFGTFEATTGSYQSCRPRRETMARLLGCSLTRVDRALARLVDAGVVTRRQRYSDRGAQLPSEYTVLCGEFRPPAPQTPDQGKRQGGLSPQTRGVVRSDKGGLSPQTRGGLSVETSDPESVDPESVDPETPLPPARTSPPEPPHSGEEGAMRGQRSAAADLVATARRRLPEFDRLVEPRHDRVLAEGIAAALERGVPAREIARTISEGDLSAAQNPARVLLYRFERLQAQERTEKADTCPVHRGQPALTCRCCRSEILAGEDPYAGREHLRPEGWAAAYARSGTRG